MKKIIFLFLVFIMNLQLTVEAHPCYHRPYYNYLINKDYYQEEISFQGCNKHSLLKETTVYYYSNGTRSRYITNTIFNSDGSVLEYDCSNVNHHIYKNKHYFTFYKNKKYQILSEDGRLLSINNYKKMTEVAPNRLLVKLDKKYGVIDFNGGVVVPAKYQKFEQINNDLFLTKLNGYYGMSDSSNKIVLKNEYDKISSFYDVFLLKKYDKYGIADKNGNIILEAEFDSIKKLGEYILTKKSGKYGVLDNSGNIIAHPIYKKIRLERNSLEGKLNKDWQEL